MAYIYDLSQRKLLNHTNFDGLRSTLRVLTDTLIYDYSDSIFLLSLFSVLLISVSFAYCTYVTIYSNTQKMYKGGHCLRCIPRF